ncbi:MAG: TonB family protein [Saprospiraceae bacterium]|nr:TonB family protein [Saprospiraceae bacterium]MDW8228524.1 TonB family protein [Saprospiraceae bacterium]
MIRVLPLEAAMNEAYTQQALEETLFAFKNKAYGAYVLRQRRAQHLTRGVIGGVLVLGLLYASPLLWLWLRQRAEAQEKQVEVNVTPYAELAAPPPLTEPEKPKPPEVAPPQVRTVKFLKPVVKADEEVRDEEIPTVEDLSKANPSRVTQEGSSDLYVDYSPKVALPEPPPPPEPPKPAPKREEPVYDFVSKRPEYPGGEEALMAYLKENLKYPRIALENNIQGIVVVRFVVDTEGRISNVEVLKDIGGGCGAEAARVVKSMPTWTPGEHNGVKVNVRFVLPVRFQLIK